MLKIVFSVLLLIPFSRAVGQDNHNGVDPVYGFDPVLYNGRYYTYKTPVNAKGTPFLSQNGFEKGCITVMDKFYQDLELNYDIYNQVLVLKYINPEGESIIFEVCESRLNSFSIGPSEFELVRRADGRQAICQFFKSGSVKVQYFWKKDLKLDNVLGVPSYSYLKPVREQILIVKNKESGFKNNRDFIRSFDPSVQVKIGNYLKNNRIKLKKVTDKVMMELLNFCNAQINP